MSCMTALLFVGMALPPNFDPHTGRLMPTRPVPIVESRRTAPPLSEDTIPIRLYRLGYGNCMAGSYGLRAAAGENLVWFLASWMDTVAQQYDDFLVRLDPATPFVETVAIAREFAVQPTHSKAIKVTYQPPSNTVTLTPSTSSPPSDTVLGVKRWKMGSPSTFLDENGAVWYTEYWAAKLAMFDPGPGVLSEWSPPSSVWLSAVDAGKDTVWFAESFDGLLQRLVPATGELTQWVVPGGDTLPGVGFPGLERRPDGSVWVARRQGGHFLAKFTSGSDAPQFTIWSLPYEVCDGPCDLAVDRNGLVWYTVMGLDSFYLESKVGRLDPATDSLLEWQLPSADAAPFTLTLDGDGNCWFVESDSCRVAKLDPARNTITEYSPPEPSTGPGIDLALDGHGGLWFTNGSDVVRISGVAGIEEKQTGSTPALREREHGTMIARGSLQLTNGETGTLLDISGRPRARLGPGANDLSSIAPGVYFLRLDSGSRPGTRRVVVIR